MRMLGLVVIVALLSGGCAAAPPLDDVCGARLDGFTHRETEVGQVRLHYVVGGSGPPVVLLHGFPETWQSWQDVAPLLAVRHTVVAVDLRGVGCSSIPPAGYDKQAMAQDVHGLVAALGLRDVALVGHDLGGWVAFAYARSYPAEVTHLVVSGALLPGFGLERLLDFTVPGQGLPHLVFFQQRDVPEQLISGREREFLTGFVGSRRVVESPAFDAAVAAYSRPGRLHAAFEQYRALYTDGADNRRGLAAPLPMPALALDGQPAPGGA